MTAHPKMQSASGYLTLQEWETEVNYRIRGVIPGMTLYTLPDLTNTADLWAAGVDTAAATIQVLEDQGWTLTTEGWRWGG